MLTKLFNLGKKNPSTDFSKFFIDAKSAEKKKVIKEVVRKANEDQKRVFHPDPNFK